MEPHDSSDSRLTLSRASAQALELPSLLGLVAERAASDLGRERLLELRPTQDRDRLEERRERYLEVARLLSARALVPWHERPIAPTLEALQDPNRAAHGRDLVQLAGVLETSSGAAERVREADPPCPSLGALVEELPSTEKLLHLLRRTFDARGEIREDATPRLAELRSRIRSARQNIYDQLSSLIDSHREHLSEETIPMRGGRLVLMLQSGSRGRVPGLVHGRSGSGRSFYFEPLDAVDGNNHLQQAVEDEEAEKRRILREVLKTLRDDLPAVLAHAELLAELDALQAIHRFAELSESRLAELGARHELKLVRGRHPLLDPRLAELRRDALGTEGHQGEVVPLDVELSGDLRALVVTGPNAGGKTVALKTLGLICAAHQCGLPVPAAAGSRLPVLDALVATVGDDQDLLTDRSTFSGRLLRLREAWEAASPDALVLLDELGSGTDPEEGAALSTALLEGLVEKRALVLVTTHLSQVAASALETEGAFCAAMQFNSSSGEPTYQLVPGPPGSSEALALAHRLGLPKPWLDRAEALLGSDHRDLRRLLAEVDRHRQELAEAQERLDTEVRDAERLRRRLAERETELAEEKRSAAKNLERKVEAFRRQTLEKMRSEVERLRREMEGGRRKGLASEAVGRLFADAPDLPATEVHEEVPLEIGGRVRHRRLGWTGVLEKIERGRAQVDVNGKSLLCKEKDLAGVAGSEVEKKPKKGRVTTPRDRAGSAASDLDTGGPELMLIGQRVEPALKRLDRFLDRSLLGQQNEVRVIHGHGSGRLRDAVRRHLRGHPAVGGQRPGDDHEGGDGATIVDLRD